MMTDDVDELLREAEANFDRTIIELAIEEAIAAAAGARLRSTSVLAVLDGGGMAAVP